MTPFNDPAIVIEPLAWDAFNGKLNFANGPYYCDTWSEEDHLSRLVESVLRGDDAFNRSVQQNGASLQDWEPTPIKESSMYSPLESRSMSSHVQHSAQQLRQYTNYQVQDQQVQVDSAVSDGADEEPSMEKPKKSLSAYNLFFQAERKRLLLSLPNPKSNGKKKPRNSHGKIGFAEMARIISARWRQISAEEKKEFEHKARLDKHRYAQEMDAYKQSMVASCVTKKYTLIDEVAVVNTTIDEPSNRNPVCVSPSMMYQAYLSALETSGFSAFEAQKSLNEMAWKHEAM